jgi:hypothetical protein
MVEIHEPVRLLNIVEADLSVAAGLVESEPALKRLIHNGWIQLVVLDPHSAKMHVFHKGALVLYEPETDDLPVYERSAAHYGGRREHLGPAFVAAAFGGAS